MLIVSEYFSVPSRQSKCVQNFSNCHFANRSGYWIALMVLHGSKASFTSPEKRDKSFMKNYIHWYFLNSIKSPEWVIVSKFYFSSFSNLQDFYKSLKNYLSHTWSISSGLSQWKIVTWFDSYMSLQQNWSIVQPFRRCTPLITY
jgi:hypothetical protein